jgi:hypothetical protein
LRLACELAAASDRWPGEKAPKRWVGVAGKASLMSPKERLAPERGLLMGGESHVFI